MIPTGRMNEVMQMDLMEAMRARHSVRQYTDRPIADDAAQALEKEIHQCNKEGGLHFQLVQNEPKAVQTWDSCLYSAGEERAFILEHLRPALAKEGLEDI